MTAHGADPSVIDQDTFADICIMYNDGVIGNLGIMQVLGALTAGQFNKVLPKGSAPYKLNDIIPQVYDYLYPPLLEQDKKQLASDNLLAFALMSPNAPSVLFGEN